MKTLINTVLKSSLVAIILLASLFSLNASAATINLGNGSLNTEIKKVIVTGNTKVILVQSANEYVNVNELDLDKVSIKQMGNTLTISSSESNPVTIVLYVKNIFRIDASDHSTVNTAGNFTLKNLQIMLKDDASARVKAKTESLYTVIKGHANLQLIGTSDHHISKTNGLAKIDTDKFTAGAAASASNEEMETISR